MGSKGRGKARTTDGERNAPPAAAVAPSPGTRVAAKLPEDPASRRRDAAARLAVLGGMKQPPISAVAAAAIDLCRAAVDMTRPAPAPAAVEVDAVMAYMAVFQPGPCDGVPLVECASCDAWAVLCVHCGAIAECAGCSASCGHVQCADSSREVQALRLARGIYTTAAMTVAEALFRAANRAGLTRDESARMWARADAANGRALRSVATTEADGIRLLERAIRGEKHP